MAIYKTIIIIKKSELAVFYSTSQSDLILVPRADRQEQKAWKSFFFFLPFLVVFSDLLV